MAGSISNRISTGYWDHIGKAVDTIETYPASEGFFAFQDSRDQEGLLLNPNSGIFFEFIPAAEIGKEQPLRLSLKEVVTGENYALVVSNNAGLWGYSIGDMVRFVSVNPYRLVVTGRTKHFISAFGEHVIGEEVEYSLMKAGYRSGSAHHGVHGRADDSNRRRASPIMSGSWSLGTSRRTWRILRSGWIITFAPGTSIMTI